MICLECGRQVRSINYRHLLACCGLNPAEYRAKHPGAGLMDPDVRKSISRPLEKNPRWRGRTGRRCTGCGKKISRKTRGERCAKCRIRTGGSNPFFGKRHDEKTRAQMKRAATLRDRSTYRGGRPDPALLSQRRREEWARRSPEEKARHLESFIAAGQLHNKKNRKTRIETLVASMLDRMGVEYRQNAQIGRYNVDFIIGSVIIECLGDFWHCNPLLWPPEKYNRSLHLTAEEKWARDAQRRCALEQQGYHFAAFWESQIRDEPGWVEQAIRELLGMGDKDDVSATE
jgi:G:T-mismatch repair DNA endonuclease (very short patch repair protein)